MSDERKRSVLTCRRSFSWPPPPPPFLGGIFLPGPGRLLLLLLDRLLLELERDVKEMVLACLFRYLLLSRTKATEVGLGT